MGVEFGSTNAALDTWTPDHSVYGGWFQKISLPIMGRLIQGLCKGYPRLISL
jgi:hypothetical protein